MYKSFFAAQLQMGTFVIITLLSSAAFQNRVEMFGSGQNQHKSSTTQFTQASWIKPLIQMDDYPNP